MHSLMTKTTTSSSFLLPSSSSLPSSLLPSSRSRSSSSLERWSLKLVSILLCCFCSTDNSTHGFTTSTTKIKISSRSSSSSRNRNRLRSDVNSPISSSSSRSSGNNRNFVLSMSAGAAATAGVDDDDDDDDQKKVKAIWTNLVPDDDTAPVRFKRILTEKETSSSSSLLLSTITKDDNTDSTTAASASLLKPGSIVRIEYVGRLVMDNDNDNDNENNSFVSGSGSMGGISSWTTQDVLECWLKEQQGLYELLANSFQEHNITGSILLDETIFTEQYVSELSNTTILSKIQCKKTIMAVKRLRNTNKEYQHGYIFDSSTTNPNLQPHQYYEFIINHPKKKPIQAISLLLSSLQDADIGNTFIIQCRSDYGYGSDGYRTNKGIIVVPPFATLQFDIKLLSIDHLPL